MTLSTHVLDATTGRPAAGVPVRLERGGAAGGCRPSEEQTEGDGRMRLAGDRGRRGVRARRLPHHVRQRAVLRRPRLASFYPEVTITFEITGRDEHYHVPLLLSPYACIG